LSIVSAALIAGFAGVTVAATAVFGTALLSLHAASAPPAIAVTAARLRKLRREEASFTGMSDMEFVSQMAVRGSLKVRFDEFLHCRVDCGTFRPIPLVPVVESPTRTDPWNAGS